MKRSVTAFVFAVLAASSTAHAQLFRAYLSSKGDDTHACTLQAPCRLLPAALAAVANGGEVWMLDSANFNASTVSITQSVSIMAIPGKVGSLQALGGGAAISIATSGVKVGLRNLVIGNNTISPGTNGVEVSSGSNGAVLSVEDCLFAGLPGQGIKASNTTASIHVRNTVFRDGAQYGVWAESGPTVDIVDSQFVASSGVLAYSHATSTTTSVMLARSSVSGGNYGAAANTDAAGSARVFVTRSTITHTAYGALIAEYNGAGTSLITVEGSSVRNNAFGYAQTGGSGSVVRSLGNNDIRDNNLDTGTLSTDSFH